jgi:hypothetical protein
VHLVSTQDQFSLSLVEEGRTQGVMKGGLLAISDGLDVFKFLCIPNTDLAGKGYRNDLELGLIETDIHNLVIVCLNLLDLVFASTIHDT